VAVKRTNRRWKRDYPYCYQWEALLAYYEDTCLCCGWRGKVTVDHVIPSSVGGRNHIVNLQPLCVECSGEKGMKSTDYRDSFLHYMLLVALGEEGIM
jgi:5-methylcytosine-specific restriction endonuclease McrA